MGLVDKVGGFTNQGEREDGRLWLWVQNRATQAVRQEEPAGRRHRRAGWGFKADRGGFVGYGHTAYRR